MAEMFSKWSDVEKYLLKVINSAMDDVADDSKKLLEKHVSTDVYDVGTDMGRLYYYDDTKKPTGQLKSSITSSKDAISNNSVTVSIHHDFDKMEYDVDTFLHGSNYWSILDVRRLLPYFIDQGKTGGFFGAKWKGLARPYISNTRNELKNGVAKKYMINA